MIPRFVVFFFLCASLSFAAETASMRVLAINTTGTDLYYMNGEGAYLSLEITPYRIGRYFQVAMEAGQKVSVYRKTMVEGKEVYESVASASIRSVENPHTALLRCSPNKWSMAVLDDSFKMKENCQLRLVNSLPVEVMLKIGDDVVEVEAGGFEVLPVAHKGRRPVVGLIAVYKRSGGEWEQFFNSPKVILPNSRMTAVALLREGGRQAKSDGAEQTSNLEVELFTFSDRLPEALY
ncbi:MAG: hypothetical protein ISQ74_07465 [Puniceicoccaceae bacterium]|nr:hypothetical protein [Puniceicoccaceae bacterium]